ncbi:hypothetical protein G6F24_015423 [Rhizopus arrhizus]|nr:hypothetical protein G6F24_015423 [Rhizopus arrhizus]
MRATKRPTNVAGVLDQAVEQVQRRAGDQHEQQQAAQQAHVEVGQPGDALLHTRHHADGGHHHHHQHDRHQHLRRIRNVEQVDQAGLHHQRADAEVGHHRDQRGKDAKAINHVADAAMDALAENRPSATPTSAYSAQPCRPQCRTVSTIASRPAATVPPGGPGGLRK